MTEADRGLACETGRTCITCSDEGLILRIVSVAADGLARCVDDEGRHEEVQVDLIDAPGAGDLVLVHARVALVRIRREEAGA